MVKNKMIKKYRIAQIKTKIVVNSDIVVDSLKDILKGMEDYRRHRNMTWLKHKVKDLIKQLEKIE